MIRIIDTKTCQVLHRRSPHTHMLNSIEVIKGIPVEKMLGFLEMLLNSTEYSLDELANMSGLRAKTSHAKLVMLVLIHTEFSYYKGKYRKKENATEDSISMFENVQAAIQEYLRAV